MPKSEEYYSRCETCDTETDRNFKSGGRSGRGEEYLNWSMYNCDVRTGGCGSNWTRSTKQGREMYEGVRGQKLRGFTRSAEVDSVHSLPSDRFQDRYAMIDWSK